MASLSIARALTTRKKEEGTSALHMFNPLNRASSERRTSASKAVKRTEISLPVKLVSTTNMLSYQAPDIANAPNASARNSTQNSVREYRSTSNASSATSGPLGDNLFSADEADQGNETEGTEAYSPVLNSKQQNEYLDQFFRSPSSARSTQSTLSSVGSETTHDSPILPIRSSSRRANVLSGSSQSRPVRKLSTIQSPPQSSKPRTSVDMFSPEMYNRPDSKLHPFSKELSELAQVVQSFKFSSAENADAKADYDIMGSKKLAQLCVADYMIELPNLRGPFADDMFVADQPMAWI